MDKRSRELAKMADKWQIMSLQKQHTQQEVLQKKNAAERKKLLDQIRQNGLNMKRANEMHQRNLER